MRITRRICQSLALPVLLAIAAPVYAAAPLPVESGKEEYVVKRNGSPIGTLKINFKRDGNRLVATSDYSIKVELQVRMTRKDNALSIVHPKGTLTAPLGLYPSTYWPPATIEQTQMIDSSDGVLMNVQTAAAGAENVTIDGRTVSAKRYKMSGDAVRDLWYDAGTGAWLKMKFKGSDNSVIEIERDWPPVWKRDLL